MANGEEAAYKEMCSFDGWKLLDAWMRKEIDARKTVACKRKWRRTDNEDTDARHNAVIELHTFEAVLNHVKRKVEGRTDENV